MISKEMFVNRIAFDNPWWNEGKINDDYLSVKPRRMLDTIYQQLIDWNLHRAILLLGPRRVGKTWLMQHIVNRLLSEAVVPQRNIIFLSIDVPVYHGSGLEELVAEAAKVSGVNITKDKLVVLFDEIQYLKDWELHLKTFSESYKNIRFIASGSAASALAKGSIESGAGRFTDIKLAPLSFREFLEISGEEHILHPSTMRISTGDYEFPEVESQERLNQLFLEYVNYGGYPELVMNRSVKANPVQFIQRDIVDKVLLRDLPSLYHIEDVRDLQAFFSYLAFHSGMIQSWETMSQGAGLRKPMIVSFLRYLEDAFLIVRHERVDISSMSLQRSTQFKVYLTNTSLRASMFQPVLKADDPYLGATIETAISAQFGIGNDRREWRYANWRAGRSQGEVDFIHIHQGTQRPDIALEVKWSDGPFDHPAELNQAVSFCNKNGIRQLWVTTRTQQGIRKMGDVELIFIPTASFAYQLDKTGVFK